MRPALILPVVVFALLVALMGAYILEQRRTGRDASVLPSALIDKPVPAFSLPPLDGTGRPPLASTDLTGRVTLVNIFASWCVPCRAEHPILMRLAADGVAVAGISYKDKPEDARAWLERLGNPYARIGVDLGGRTAIDWGVYGVPETFIVDAGGRVRYRHVGPIHASELEDIILPILRKLSR